MVPTHNRTGMVVEDGHGKKDNPNTSDHSNVHLQLLILPDSIIHQDLKEVHFSIRIVLSAYHSSYSLPVLGNIDRHTKDDVGDKTEEESKDDEK